MDSSNLYLSPLASKVQVLGFSCTICLNVRKRLPVLFSRLRHATTGRRPLGSLVFGSTRLKLLLRPVAAHGACLGANGPVTWPLWLSSRLQLFLDDLIESGVAGMRCSVQVRSCKAPGGQPG